MFINLLLIVILLIIVIKNVIPIESSNCNKLNCIEILSTLLRITKIPTIPKVIIDEIVASIIFSVNIVHLI